MTSRSCQGDPSPAGAISNFFLPPPHSSLLFLLCLSPSSTLLFPPIFPPSYQPSYTPAISYLLIIFLSLHLSIISPCLSISTCTSSPHYPVYFMFSWNPSPQLCHNPTNLSDQAVTSLPAPRLSEM